MCLRDRTYPLAAIVAFGALILAWSSLQPAGAGGFVEPRGPRVFSNEHHLGYGLAPYPCGPAFFRPDGAALGLVPPAGPPADYPDPILDGQGIELGLERGVKRRYGGHRTKRWYPARPDLRHKTRRRGKHRDRIYVGGIGVPFGNGPVTLNGVPIERDCP